MLEFKDQKNIRISEQLSIKPEYKIHPYISGNKYRKLKYNLLKAQETKQHSLLTFGGAFSNHIAAVAAAGKKFGFKTIGIIRGEELVTEVASNPTLKFAADCGMLLKFVSRSDFRRKNEDSFLEALKSQYGQFYLIPEGGTNALAIKGCEEILTEADAQFDFICCSVGTGGTISGLINSALPHQKVLGFPALKGGFLTEEITKFAHSKHWELMDGHHFGGYGKVSDELIQFINDFKFKYNVPLDPIYTGKMLFGIYDMIQQGFFSKTSRILVIHTGGLQGIEGMNMRLKQQNRSLLV
ncbi:1-aminocyclopropane-1-carboxylate deaminase/D-cysteine desulfhydrase [Subsaximicrobium wynnwilliamsii]|uniref:1-aminocyclopropane-1-carboxylate deaminase/D-cysteine desulfhydrase n=1 Tax=Subsaximicrobium wynnwilliamsii TaxID=291179 RepID=A0A5C6ZLI3_9FLAO|nr:pyridoxal-phosphate dependent enzyme [Subsaximicrobium wynnwilliamsii]TXD85373.1 1-aminocyclopropane-1-carboxylate deaminase/D-cysteine desulfhydrase [Subsaximicrobium wynnwilliamsii]TXD90725.1 1-aminocyclopropane-1-carboxylate deaminase/D-cysteine desulfhydrase [Subsaximicrobium wynnwilliamsii]TXE05233.1 1-aminocyclopropane-1-carboxylate deaminase/D-cysteine desulfhydrase [Subsaximicrobium wynnwilliamsii]